MPTEPTTDDLVAFARFVQTQNPHSLDVFLSVTEAEFIEGVEGALLHAVMALETGRKQFCQLGELALSKQIARDLRAASIPATSEEHSNGHVDITVKHPNGKAYRYLGECKIWQSIPYHVEGVSQLLKYSTGRHQRGCCLEFVKIGDAAGKLAAIREYFDNELPLEQQNKSVEHSAIKGGFITVHRHVGGNDVEVLHFSCDLHV